MPGSRGNPGCDGLVETGRRGLDTVTYSRRPLRDGFEFPPQDLNLTTHSHCSRPVDLCPAHDASGINRCTQELLDRRILKPSAHVDGLLRRPYVLGCPLGGSAVPY